MLINSHPYVENIKNNNMTKKKSLLICIITVLYSVTLYGQNDQVAAAQHTILGQNSAQVGASVPVRNMHPDAQWFPDAGLGLFIHFGISSVHGGIDLSWAMYANKSWEDGEIPPRGILEVGRPLESCEF